MTEDGSSPEARLQAEDGKRHRSEGRSTVPRNGASNQIKKNKQDEGRARQRHSSEDSEVSMDSIQEYIPTPPDGGWGWVIVVSSMMCNLIVDGIGYSFGVFLSAFVDAFKEPKSKVSLVGSLLCGTYLFAGPVVSAMTNKFGCRPVVIAGSCIATVAFLLATLSPNIEILILTYGILGGFGLGMVYLPSIVSVGYYFEKKRAFATGLAVCGSGLGTFIFPPLSEILLDQFSWQGGLLIIAGIIFHACIFGALMRPLKADPKKVKESKQQKTRKKLAAEAGEVNANRDRTVSESSSAVHGVGDGGKENNIQEKVMLAKLQREKQLQDADSEMGSSPSVAFAKRSGSGTYDHHATEFGHSPVRDLAGSPASKTIRFLQEDGNSGGDNKGSADHDGTSAEVYLTPPLSPTETAENTPVKDGRSYKDKEASRDKDHQVKNGTNPHGGSETIPLLEVPAPVIRPAFSHVGSYGGSRTNITNLQSVTSLHISKRDLARPLYRKDIFYSGSVLNIPQFRSQPDMKSYITSITTIPGEMEFVQGPSPSSKCINKVCSCLPRAARDVLSEMADVSLFKDISFMLICLGNVAAFLGFYVPFVFLVDLSVSLQIEKTEATFLISIIGITNTVGRVIIGKLADLHIVDSLVITYISIAICGLMTALVPFCNTYPLLAANAAVFGLGMAAYISLSSIIICDRMGIEKLTNAFGLLSMVRGIAGMAGPPLAGFMYDNSGSYDLSFYMGGLLLFVGAACHILLHLPALRPTQNQHNFVEDIQCGEMLQVMGSQPHIVTMEEALSAAKEE